MKITFFLIFSIIVFIMLIIFGSLLLLLENQRNQHSRQENRYYSYRYGDILRQISEDLTQYSRSYVITGDTIWENKYSELRDYRRDMLSNPEEQRSLLDSMHNMPFSEQEFDLLRGALRQSYRLSRYERDVMNSAKAIHENGDIKLNRDYEIKSLTKKLYNDEFNLYKSGIMTPISSFEKLIDQRTKIEIRKYEREGKVLLYAIIGQITLIILLSTIAFLLIRRLLTKEKKIAMQLRERVKEQGCLYKISQMTEHTANTIEHVLDGAASVVPLGWQYPEVTCARITFKELIYTSANFKETQWKQESEISNNNEVYGRLEVFYTEEKPLEDIGPFLFEEQTLLENIVKVIYGFYERKNYMENLVLTNKQLETEIYEKNNAQEGLIKSDERFTLAVKASNAGIWDLNVITHEAYWSPIHFRILGYGNNEFSPTIDSVRRILHDDDKQLFDEAFKEHIFNGKTLDFEIRLYTKQNNLRWYRMTGESARDEHGKSVRIVGTLTDITDKKIAETTLAEKEQQLQYALDVSNEGIWEIYENSAFIDFSDRCYTMLGYLPNENNTDAFDFWSKIIHKEDQEKALVSSNKEIMTSGLHDSIYRVKAKNEEIKWIHTKGKAVEISEEGNPVRVVGTMSDITERMQQEETVVNAILETEDKERSRIASEIHDGLQQTMTTSLMSFEKVRSSTDFKDQVVYDRFHLGYQYLKKAIEESRTLAHNLMPKVVDKSGIVAAVESLINAIRNTSKTEFAFNQNLNDERLKLSVEMTFYRITQEAINNVVKYANAPKCNVQLLKYPDLVLLTIDDDGDGFETSDKVNTFGINSMRTRAESIGAYFEIISKPGKGTQVLIEMPIK